MENLPKLEERVLKFWKENQIFEKSLQKTKKGKLFVFFEGPPYANGNPGIHHFLVRVFKDVVCRYKTMKGYFVPRIAGWDTHGLPTEMEVEKKLGLKSKKEIEEKGVAKFVKECKKNVFYYIKKFEKFTERIGFWIDLKRAYITCTNEYIETLWFLMKKFWQKKLLEKNFRVCAWCPRCQTVLSSHEVAQGYKKIKENSIYVKFKLKDENAFFLVWTTTPWTLPSNIALAVHPEILYQRVKVGEETLILSKKAKEKLALEGEVEKEFLGKELEGKRYESLFDFYKANFEKERAFEVLLADFVKEEEGTGIVHIAPAFGEEDFELIKKENERSEKKFPILHFVDAEGKFKKEVSFWQGIFVKDADPLIVENLKQRNFLLKEELFEHDYPFCWRCKSPLLYYLKESWFLKVTKVKERLLKENQKINWYPPYLKEGRFGQWLKEVKDWAISRERYWGAPLPVFKCENCGHLEVLGSKKDIFSQKFSQNEYYLLRHGEAKNQILDIVSSKVPEKIPCPLTKKGILQVKKVAKFLKKIGIDLIFSSDLLRCQQTAEIVSKELGKKVVFDKRLREIQAGIFEGKKLKEYESFWKDYSERFKKRPKGGENYNDVKKRMYQFLKEVEKKYQGKKILIISHQRPLTMLEGALKGFSQKEFFEFEKKKIKNAEIRKVEFKIFPYNQDGELDFHRPFVDEIEFFCPKCNGKMKREKEVIDVWFDSGAMPFAQCHWPFEKGDSEKKPPKLYPADFIAEGIDQTRGWFYTLLATSTLLGFCAPFKNVLSLGLVLDEKGEKMSKSRGNVVDPYYIMEKYSADATRWYFFTKNLPEEPKLFSENDVKDALWRFLNLLFNCYSFFETYAKKTKNFEKIPQKTSKLNFWILSRFNSLLLKVEKLLENYQIVLAARELEKFLIEDFSGWYIRRSRKNFQYPESKKQLKEDSQVFSFVFLNYLKILAPFLPFVSEILYQKLTQNNFKKPKSIHLKTFPKANPKLINKKLEKEMERAKEICSEALAQRKAKKIKVRQPLAKMIINERLSKEILEQIKEEVNVKEIVIDLNLKEKVLLDFEITPELKEEGLKREIVRNLQNLRKELKLLPKQKIEIKISGEKEIEEIFKKYQKEILVLTKACLLKKKPKIEKEIEIEGKKVKVFLRK